MNLTLYARTTAFVLALSALLATRGFWWGIENTNTGSGLFYSSIFTVLLANGIAIISLTIGALLLAIPDRRGLWAVYFALFITFGGLYFPGREAFSLIPFLSLTKEPLLALAGNILIVPVLVCLHVLMYRADRK
ncbi:MAG: hypothetical protein JJT75_14380 [Opitutales bacterium]|nr:hypothetical protein [Opitutales bacterium]MCH8541192.1 hypothetical protein [Opitutales bacterium]